MDDKLYSRDRGGGQGTKCLRLDDGQAATDKPKTAKLPIDCTFLTKISLAVTSTLTAMAI